MLQINTNQLYKIFRDFYTLTSIRIVLIDSDFNEIFSYPDEYTTFCKLLRRNMAFNADCVNSDKNACLKCAKSRDLVIYQCHNGLMEAVVPIYSQGKILGYVMYGQVALQEDYEKTKKMIAEKFSGPQFQEVQDAFLEIPVKTEPELKAIATVLQALASYMLSNSWITAGKEAFVRQLEAYIEERVDQNITVEDICLEFGIGRTRLYEIGTEYLGCGIAEFVRKKRIEYARNLLEKSDVPISEIADKTGFSDYVHFSRVFKQMTGISAREYRNGRKNERNNERDNEIEKISVLRTNLK